MEQLIEVRTLVFHLDEVFLGELVQVFYPLNGFAEVSPIKLSLEYSELVVVHIFSRIKGVF